MQQEMQAAQQKQMQSSLIAQAGQLAGTPMLDPSKNPEALEGMNNALQGEQGQQVAQAAADAVQQQLPPQ